jgi:hypothetical protein
VVLLCELLDANQIKMGPSDGVFRGRPVLKQIQAYEPGAQQRPRAMVAGRFEVRLTSRQHQLAGGSMFGDETIRFRGLLCLKPNCPTVAPRCASHRRVAADFLVLDG